MNHRQDNGTNPLLRVRALGQSVWLDYIRRSLIANGELDRLIQEDGLAGLTSNPVIFEQAILHSDDYESAVAALRCHGASTEEMYDALVLGDIARASDVSSGLRGKRRIRRLCKP